MTKIAIFALYLVYANGNVTYLGFLQSLEDCEAYGYNAVQIERVMIGKGVKYHCEPILKEPE